MSAENYAAFMRTPRPSRHRRISATGMCTATSSPCEVLDEDVRERPEEPLTEALEAEDNVEEGALVPPTKGIRNNELYDFLWKKRL